MVDWTDPKAHITEHFTVGDACMLHQWGRLANAQDGLDDNMKDKLAALCQKAEVVREFLGCAMNVHCMFRSPAYNKVIGALPEDVHAQGLAVDFDCAPAMTIEQVQSKLEPQLESFGLRMERNTKGWVHIDTHSVGHLRYFYP